MKFPEKIKNTFHYEFTHKEWILAVTEGIVYLIITAVLFYNTILAAVVMLPYLHFHLKKKEKELKKKQTEQTNLQFKDGMLAISSALSAGYSVENALKSAARELASLYGEDAVLVKEFMEINRKAAMNGNVEDALTEMAEHIGIEDAVYFAEVFRYAKRSGGNLIEIIEKTAGIISDKITVKEDINVLISGRKMEQKVMNMMPFGIIAYLRIAAYEFISPMYGNLMGVIVMTLCLAGYLAAKVYAEKLIDIRVS